MKRPTSKQRKSLRRRLSESQNHRCCYCGCAMAENPYADDGCTIDHLKPHATGGPTDYWNCVAACRTCNNRRDRIDPLQFFEFVTRYSRILQVAA